MKKIIITLLMLWSSISYALDIECTDCTTNTIETNAATIVAAGGGKLTLPACDTVQSGQIDITLADGVTFEIVGKGREVTLLRKGVSKIIMKISGNSATLFKISNVGFVGSPTVATEGMQIYYVDSLIMSNCKFHDSHWANYMMEIKGFTTGVIADSWFEGCKDCDGIYVITLGSNYIHEVSTCINDPVNHTSCTDNTCTTYYTEEINTGACTAGSWCADCRDSFWDWYKDPTHNNGWTFPDPTDNGWDWTPGSANALYIEDNTFHIAGPAMEGNWNSTSGTVFRYNNVYNYDESTNTSYKPGAYFAEVYNNNFYVRDNAIITGTRMGTLRCDTVLYNNYYEKLSGDGYINAYFCSYGFCYPEQVIPHEIYIWGNTAGDCTNCGSSCNPNNATCWREQEGAFERIAPDENYFFRAPTSGDRIYSGNPSQPVAQYTYPHPLRSSIPPPSEPSQSGLNFGSGGSGGGGRIN